MVCWIPFLWKFSYIYLFYLIYLISLRDTLMMLSIRIRSYRRHLLRQPGRRQPTPSHLFHFLRRKVYNAQLIAPASYNYKHIDSTVSFKFLQLISSCCVDIIIIFFLKR